MAARMAERMKLKASDSCKCVFKMCVVKKARQGAVHARLSAALYHLHQTWTFMQSSLAKLL